MEIRLGTNYKHIATGEIMTLYAAGFPDDDEPHGFAKLIEPGQYGHWGGFHRVWEDTLERFKLEWERV